jgi:hypothetical protein
MGFLPGDFKEGRYIRKLGLFPEVFITIVCGRAEWGRTCFGMGRFGC